MQGTYQMPYAPKRLSVYERVHTSGGGADSENTQYYCVKTSRTGSIGEVRSTVHIAVDAQKTCEQNWIDAMQCSACSVATFTLLGKSRNVSVF